VARFCSVTYSETIDYLFARLPMFQRIGAAAYKADLKNIVALCQFLGNPQAKLKCIHIAGTNGKGSVSSMMAAVLQSSGYKTGLFTSPHLHDFRERIKVDGKMMDRKRVVEFVEKVKPFIESHNPSFFELTVGMCFEHFAREKVQVAVIETGLGGRLDSTNIIYPMLCIITNIGWDHQNLLGDTLEKIAFEKAGIIKPGIPVVISESNTITQPIFNAKARDNVASIYYADELFKLENLSYSPTKPGLHFDVLKKGQPYLKNVHLQLSGLYQQRNVKAVFQAVEVLRNMAFRISDENFKKALSKVVDMTGIKGRWQILSQNPLTIADTGHNKNGLEEVTFHLGKIKYNHLHFVLGVVNDKDLNKVFEAIPKNNVTFYFCKPDVPRGLDAKQLKDFAQSCGLEGKSFTSVKAALKAAQKHAEKEDLIFVGGSTFTVAEVV